MRNNASIADIFADEEMQDFLKSIFRDLDENPYTLRKFLTFGYEKYYEGVINELKDSFRVITAIDNKDDKNTFEKVVRCVDGTTFSLEDIVYDMVDPTGKSLYPISRMYEDDRGLHIRLQVNKETITWRTLSQIEHYLPEAKEDDTN